MIGSAPASSAACVLDIPSRSLAALIRSPISVPRFVVSILNPPLSSDNAILIIILYISQTEKSSVFEKYIFLFQMLGEIGARHSSSADTVPAHLVSEFRKLNLEGGIYP